MKDCLQTEQYAWVYDEISEEPCEIQIEWERCSTFYYATILKTKELTIWDVNQIGKTKNEAIDLFTNKLSREIENREETLKDYIENEKNDIKYRKALLKKALKQKDTKDERMEKV